MLDPLGRGVLFLDITTVKGIRKRAFKVIDLRCRPDLVRKQPKNEFRLDSLTHRELRQSDRVAQVTETFRKFFVFIGRPPEARKIKSVSNVSDTISLEIKSFPIGISEQPD